VNADLRTIVECLLTAHYSEAEILDYLSGPLGYSEDDALLALRDVAGSSR
jgi:hypothetical protein